jgi:RHS repeat-associated protein
MPTASGSSPNRAPLLISSTSTTDLGVAGLTDSAAKLAGRYAYDVWGQADLSVPGTQIGTKNKFRFTGEALDPRTQLYFLRSRYYDATVGRFLSRDTLPGFVATPLSRNHYQYSLGNPLRYTDPSGLSATEINTRAGSLLANCGINCGKIVEIIVNAIESAASIIAMIFVEGGPSAQTSVTATDAGNTALQTGSAVVVNPDTVTAVVGTIKTQPNLIRDAAGLLSHGYTKADLDLAYGEVCSNSYGAGVCLRGQQYAEQQIVKSARDQGFQPGFQQ